MAARIGADDLDVSGTHPRLLRQISGIEPEPAETHVILDAQSTQRLAVVTSGGGLVAALWPAELKEQATYLYGQRLGTPMVETALARGWTAEPSPHLAFRSSHWRNRLYMKPTISAAEYVRRWEAGDLAGVGQYERSEVKSVLWPWLKSRGYVTEGDEGVLDEWLATRLGKRPAFLRPGLRLKRRWDLSRVSTEQDALVTAKEIRDDVNEILAAAREPLLAAA
jgi:hypothetical protein